MTRATAVLAVVMIAAAFTSPAGAERAAGERVGALEGSIRDEVSGDPLADVLVLLEPGRKTALTGADGRFGFTNLAPGRYRITSLHIGYSQPAPLNVEVLAGETAAVEIGLERVPIVEQVVVRPAVTQPAGMDEGAQTLSRQQLSQLPGTFDDPLRALTRMPAVSGVNDLKAEIRIRGAEPEDSVFRLDGVTLENPYHFPWARGSTAALNPDAFDLFSVKTAGLGPELGDTVGGVVYLAPTQRGSEGAFLDASLGTLVTNLTGGGPVAGGSWVAGARYSNLALYRNLYDITHLDVPAFGDLILRARLPVDERSQLVAGVLGLGNGLNTTGEDGRLENDLASRGVGAYTGLDAALGDDSLLTWRMALWRSRQSVHTSVGDHLSSSSDRLRFSIEASTFAAGMRWRSGVELSQLEADIAGSLQSVEGLPPLSAGATRVGAFGGFGLPLSPSWSLDFGLRADRDSRYGQAPVQPRLAARFADPASNGWSLHLAAERHAQFPRYEQEFLAGGSALGVPVSDQLAIGVKLPRAGTIEIDASAYSRWLRGPISEAVNRFPDLPEPMIRFDRGRAEGVELAMSRPGTRLRWQLAAAFMRARQEKDGRSSRRNGDQPYKLDALAAYRLTDHWELLAGLRVAAGLPYTAREAEGDGEVVLGPLNGGRLPSYLRLDLRSSWQWTWKRSLIRLYVEMNNLTDQHNVRAESLHYDAARDDYDLDQSQAMPRLPAFGVQIVWGGAGG